MIEAQKNCKILETPAGYEHLLGQNCKATNENDLRNTGTQKFELVGIGCVYGNADSGFKIEVLS